MQKEMSTILHEASQGDPVSLARALVATPSVNPELEETGTGEKEVAVLVAGWLEQWGVSVQVSEVAAGRYNVLGHLGRTDKGKALLLSGHLDTVGISGMTIDPFGPKIENGRLWGRGSCDMKGGVASILACVARLSREKLDHGAVYIALTADEEYASVGMQALLENGLMADAAIVCEPTNLAIMPAHKGFLWAEASFRGNAAHGSRSDVGIDAIEHAGHYLARISDLRSILESRDPHPLLGYGSIHAGTVSGGSAPSVYPASCKLILERRTLPGEEAVSVMGELQTVLEGLGKEIPELNASLKETMVRSSTEVAVGSVLVEKLAEACQNAKVDVSIEGMTAWVEASLLNEAGIPAVCFGPGSIGQAHSDNEWVDLQEIERCASILERFVRGFLEQRN